MLKLEKTKSSIDLYGEVFELRCVSVSDSEALSKSLKDLKEEEELPMLVKFLDDLGLPEAKTQSMEVAHLKQVIEYIMPSKKK